MKCLFRLKKASIHTMVLAFFIALRYLCFSIQNFYFMRKIYFTLAFLIFFVAKNYALDVAVSTAVFSTGDQSYAELQFHFVGKTMRFKMQNDTLHWQASANITILFKQGEKIVQFDKYQLNGPILSTPQNFFDLKRYALAQGAYSVEITIEDVWNVANKKNITLPLIIDFDKTKIQQSDIQLIKTFSKDTSNSPLAKNGYIMQGLPFDFCDKNMERLIVYNEVYNSQNILKEDFSVTYAIYNERSGLTGLPVFTQYKTLNPAVKNILFTQLDVSKIPSGNYFLSIEIRNKNKELLSQKKIDFQRSNPYLNLSAEGVDKDAIKEEFVEKLMADTLRYSLKAIFCKMNGDESKILNEVIKGNDPTTMRTHLFRYWAKKNPNKPEKAYQDYMKIARAVDRTYRSGFGYGFETDRGYVFMKYGRPDDMTSQVSSPDAAGYEVWSYNDFPLTKQTNVKFLFWDGDGSGNMRILHSNALGEIADRNWKTKLYRNSRNQWTNDGFDPTDVQDNVGRNAGRMLEDF